MAALSTEFQHQYIIARNKSVIAVFLRDKEMFTEAMESLKNSFIREIEMNILYALIVITSLANGDFEHTAVEFYPSKAACLDAVFDGQIFGECEPVTSFTEN